MADFELAVKKILNFEGCYSNDPKDYGGETKFGIAKKFYPEVDIKNLTQEEAEAIYKRDYWDKLMLDNVINQGVADELFDIAVNMAWHRAALFIQQILNIVTKLQLKEDGLIGYKTLSAINNYKYPETLVAALNGLQFMHYWKRVQEDVSQKVFFRGWLKRVEM